MIVIIVLLYMCNYNKSIYSFDKLIVWTLFDISNATVEKLDCV